MMGLYHWQVQDMCASQAPVPLSDMCPFPFLVADVEPNGCKCETSRLEPLSNRCAHIFNEFTCKHLFVNAKTLQRKSLYCFTRTTQPKAALQPENAKVLRYIRTSHGHSCSLCSVRGMPGCLAHLLRLATSNASGSILQHPVDLVQ